MTSGTRTRHATGGCRPHRVHAARRPDDPAGSGYRAGPSVGGRDRWPRGWKSNPRRTASAVAFVSVWPWIPSLGWAPLPTTILAGLPRLPSNRRWGGRTGRRTSREPNTLAG